MSEYDRRGSKFRAAKCWQYSFDKEFSYFLAIDLSSITLTYPEFLCIFSLCICDLSSGLNLVYLWVSGSWFCVGWHYLSYCNGRQYRCSEWVSPSQYYGTGCKQRHFEAALEGLYSYQSCPLSGPVLVSRS
jgi:hypothetical protein